MTDLVAGRASLRLQGLCRRRRFSYGDVLGAGRGWASTILFNSRVRAEFEQFFARRDTFALALQRLPDDGGAEGADPGPPSIAGIRRNAQSSSKRAW